MNLLVVVPAYEPAWAFGGVVRSMSSLCRGLAALGHRVTVYTINNDGEGATLPVPCGVPVDQGGVTTYFFPSTFGAKSIWDSRSLIRCLKGTVTDFQLIYTAAFWQWLGIAVASQCKKHQVPLVTGVHGSLDQALRHRSRWRKRLYWHAFLQRSLAHHRAYQCTHSSQYAHQDRIESPVQVEKPLGVDLKKVIALEAATKTCQEGTYSKGKDLVSQNVNA